MWCSGLTLGVILYFIYYIIYYTITIIIISYILYLILYSSLLLIFFCSIPISSHLLPSPLLICSFQSIIYSSHSKYTCRVFHLLIYIPAVSNLSKQLSMNIKRNTHLSHSKYTCRYFDILIYIIISSTILTPHVLSEWMVEVCRFYKYVKYVCLELCSCGELTWIVLIWLERYRWGFGVNVRYSVVCSCLGLCWFIFERCLCFVLMFGSVSF